MGNLTQLSDVKTILQIASSDTSQDAILALLIPAISSQIESYCNRTFGVATYTENLPPNNTTALQLANWPINSVTSITDSGTILQENSDYYLYSQYSSCGQIYRPTGWYGQMLGRGLTFDPFENMIVIKAVYSAGYNLPGMTPVVGAHTLPSSIQLASMQMTAKAYSLCNSGNIGENLNSISEGAESLSFDNPAKIPSDLFSITAGLPVQFASLLNPFKKFGGI